MGAYSRKVAPAASNYRKGRNGVRPDVIILHHSATTSTNVVLGMMSSGSRKVSSNSVITNAGENIQVVNEGDTPFTNGHLGWNRRSFTAEIQNSSVGGSWPVSAAAHEAAAQWCAYLHKKYGIVLDRTHVFGHRELYTRYKAGYATACPGGLNLDWIVARAREIAGLSGSGAGANPGALGGGSVASPYPTGTQWGYSLQKVQYRVNRLGYTPKLDEDGVKGPKTVAGIKWAQKKLGVTVDGDWGNGTQEAYDRWSQGGKSAPAKSKVAPVKAPAFPLPKGSFFGPKSGPAQSVSGYYSHRSDLKRWQQQMIARGWVFDHGADGLYGDETATIARLMQKQCRLKQDSLIGPDTWAVAWTAPIT